MKPILLPLVLITTMIWSCQNDEVSSEEEYLDPNAILYEPKIVDPSELSDFNGLKVIHRFSTNIESSINLKGNATSQKISNPYLQQKSSSISDETPSPSDLIDDESFTDLVEETILSYKMPFTEDTETNLLQILEDFPEITPETMVDNLELIENYYAENLTSLIEEKASNNPTYSQKSNLSKRSNIEKTEVTLWHANRPSSNINKTFGTNFGDNLINKTLGRYAMAKAANFAGSRNNEEYTELGGGDTKRDAYRHMVWHGFLAKHYNSGSKIHKRRFAQLVGYAYELNNYYEATDKGTSTEDAKKIVLESPATWMDLHNNEVGRKVWDDNSSYRLIIFKIPYYKRWRLRWRTVRLTVGVNDASWDKISDEAQDRINNQSRRFDYTKSNGNKYDKYVEEKDDYDVNALPKLISDIKRINDKYPVYISTSTIGSGYAEY